MSVAYALAFTVCTMTVSGPPPVKPTYEECQRVETVLQIPGDKVSPKTHRICNVEMYQRARKFNSIAQWKVIQQIKAKNYPFSELVVKKGSCTPLKDA